MGGELILVVEPERDIAFVLESLLRDEGYQVDAVEPFCFVSQEQIGLAADLVMLDVYSPPGVVPSHAESLFHALEGRQVPILCLSTDMRVEREMAAKPNVVGTIELPFDAGSLLQKVRRALDAKRPERGTSSTDRAA